MEWKDNPITEVVQKYLIDSIQEESEIIADAIANGAIIDEREQIKVATICVTLRRIADITKEEIEGFYNDRSARKQGDNPA